MSMTLLDVNGEVMAKVCTYFDEHDLVNLGLTCRHFGLAQAGHAASFVEETARQMFNHAATDSDRAALPRYEGEISHTYTTCISFIGRCSSSRPSEKAHMHSVQSRMKTHTSSLQSRAIML